MLMENHSSQRLHFRRLKAAHAEELLKFFLNPEAVRYVKNWDDPYQMPMARIESQIARYEKDGDGLCALIDKATGAFIGQCGLLWQEVDGKRELEVGYHLQPAHWGKGYATEAARACRDFGFDKGLADQIISIVKTDNLPSQRVAERNGMTKWKQTTFRIFDVNIFRITKAEWEALKEK